MLEAEDLTYKVRGCIYKIYRQLGSGFLEKVYENSLIIELRSSGLHVTNQKSISVCYKNEVIGEYIADIIVEN